METKMEWTREVMEALAAPFPEDEIEFLPKGYANGRARALAYIDARSVMRRLDAVVGPGNWSFDFELLSPDGKMVKGKLTVLGVTKCDAGEADQEDEALKSAVSDALKRCAVHFGIGRYLYYLPRVWAPYDSQTRRFLEPPRLDPAAVRRALAICGVLAYEPTARGGRTESVVAEAGAAALRVGDRERTGPEPAPSAAGAPGAGPAGATRVGMRPAGFAAAREPAAGEVEAPVCSQPGCGKPLTRGQHEVSLRAYGRPLCPACQKAQGPRPEARSRVSA